MQMQLFSFWEKCYIYYHFNVDVDTQIFSTQMHQTIGSLQQFNNSLKSLAMFMFILYAKFYGILVKTKSNHKIVDFSEMKTEKKKENEMAYDIIQMYFYFISFSFGSREKQQACVQKIVLYIIHVCLSRNGSRC